MGKWALNLKGIYLSKTVFQSQNTVHLCVYTYEFCNRNFMNILSSVNVPAVICQVILVLPWVGEHDEKLWINTLTCTCRRPLVNCSALSQDISLRGEVILNPNAQHSRRLFLKWWWRFCRVYWYINLPFSSNYVVSSNLTGILKKFFPLKLCVRSGRAFRIYF